MHFQIFLFKTPFPAMSCFNVFKKSSYEIDVTRTAFIFDHCFLDTDCDLET